MVVQVEVKILISVALEGIRTPGPAALDGYDCRQAQQEFVEISVCQVKRKGAVEQK